MSRYLRLCLLLLWTGCLVWQSLTPHPLPAPKWLRWDKLQHAGGYALLTLLAGSAFARGRLQVWAGVALSATVFGGIMEWGQRIAGHGRRPQFGDMLANAIGALAVLLAVALLQLCRRGSARPPQA